MKNESYRANIAYTSQHAFTGNDWYFDSGCSRHMTSDQTFLSNIKPYSNCHVTFGDGVKAKIIGKGQLNYPGLSCLTEALLVEGLTANLISISQLCDLSLRVDFTRDECVVINEEQVELIKGTRTPDDCYIWSPVKVSQVTKCLMSKADEAKIGKQVQKLHKMVPHLTTARVLEIPHMDLLGPMQTESLSGKGQVQRDKGESIEGIAPEFSGPIIPQQNEVVEIKNRTLQEMARLMMLAKDIPLLLRAQALNTAMQYS